MTVTDTVERNEDRELNLTDRCDRCSSQAYARAVKVFNEKPLELLFCGHHFRETAYQLGLTGWTVQNNTDKIQ
jgi:ribosomal protein S14